MTFDKNLAEKFLRLNILATILQIVPKVFHGRKCISVIFLEHGRGERTRGAMVMTARSERGKEEGVPQGLLDA